MEKGGPFSDNLGLGTCYMLEVIVAMMLLMVRRSKVSRVCAGTRIWTIRMPRNIFFISSESLFIWHLTRWPIWTKQNLIVLWPNVNSFWRLVKLQPKSEAGFFLHHKFDIVTWSWFSTKFDIMTNKWPWFLLISPWFYSDFSILDLWS